MNELIQLMVKRRSIRSYLEDAVQPQYRDAILKAGLHAPTGGNHQYTRFLVVEDKCMLEEINDIVRRTFASMEIVEGVYQNKTIIKARQQGEKFHCLFHAPILVNVLAPKAHPNSMADSANAIQNMQLAATSLGLGACWINQLHWLTDHEELRAYLYRMGMREDEDVFGSVVFGHTVSQLSGPLPRKEGRILFAGNH